MEREETRVQEEARALENLRPENFQLVPKYVTGLDSQVKEVTDKLDNIKTLGLVGMGGLGKTTLAKEVFNRLASDFEYTCFIPNVKLIDEDERKVTHEIGENMHFHGKRVEEGSQQEWRTKPLLLVLDDISGECDGRVLSDIEGITAVESRIIFTTCNQRPLDWLGEVYRVDLLDNSSAKQLFLSCAFPDQKNPPTELEELMNAIIRKCEGLPLALEVFGKFLRTTENVEVWEQTLHAMGTAEDESAINESLWATLRLSYDGLEEKVQQIFLDATTFFSGSRLTLHEAKAVWRVAYGTMTESVLWQKLVDMSLVYDVKDNEYIRVHELLQSLGRKIARESINNGKWREWDGDEGSIGSLEMRCGYVPWEVFARRIGDFGKWARRGVTRAAEDMEIQIAHTGLRTFREFRYWK